MGAFHLGRCLGLGVLAMMASALRAQAVAAPAAGNASVDTSSAAGLLWPQKTIPFNSSATPVFGMPLADINSMVRCGNDGTTFFNLQGSSNAGGVSLLYSISTSGVVTSLMRKAPLEFNDVSVRDFFVSEQHVVSLLQATKRDDQGVHEVRYFLSKLDTQGDFRELVEVEGHFRPLKIAVFGGDDVMVLGWDEANLLPMLAMLKADGTIRYFLDVADNKAKGVFGRGSVSTQMLEDAAFVAYGKDVLLSFPGTVKPVLELNTTGVVRSIPISIPAGFVLHDVLYSGARASVVVRLQAKKEGEKPGLYDESHDPQQRLFEMSANSGALLREFVPDKSKVSEVACAGASWTAIFYKVAGSDQTTAASNGAQPSATCSTQLVVSSVRR